MSADQTRRDNLCPLERETRAQLAVLWALEPIAEADRLRVLAYVQAALETPISDRPIIPRPDASLKRRAFAAERQQRLEREPNPDEAKLVAAFNGKPRAIADLAVELFEGNESRVRNALRRPVKSWGVLKQIGRGQYVRTESLEPEPEPPTEEPVCPVKAPWGRKVRTEPVISSRTPKTPRSKAVDETVALAMRKGQIGYRDLQIYKGIEHGSADDRIQAALNAYRITRVARGLYEATEEEYVRISVPIDRKGKPLKLKVDDLMELMRGAREGRSES